MCDFSVGIDFGTTFSGFSFSFKDNPEIVQFSDYGGSMKERTAILYKREQDSWKAIEFGQKAFMKNNSIKVGREDYCYVERFKLLLDDKLKDTVPLKQGLNIEQILYDYLGYLKSQAMIKLRNVGAVDSSIITWCLTIPAKWTLTATSKMRNAALSTGMISTPTSPHLVFCSEPEAAIIYFNAKDSTALEVGDMVLWCLKFKVTVCDAGGGTTDVSSYEVGPNKKLTEISSRDGVNDAGGSFVDENFISYFTKRYPNSVDILKRKPEIKAKLLKEWDIVKKNFSFDMTENHTLEIPSALTDVSEIKEDWEMSAMDLRSIFEPIVQKILLCLTQHLDKACTTPRYAQATCRKILLAGGFGNSGYLALRLHHFAEMNELILIRTAVAQCMVVGGSTLFGHNPSTYIQKHVISISYGVKSHIPYNPSKHTVPESRLIPHGNGYVIRDCYDAFVTPGQVVALDERVYRMYSPYSTDSTQLCFEIYSQEPKLLIDDSSRLVCRVDIDLPKEYANRPLVENRVRVEMDFGMAEVLIKAIHLASGKSVEWLAVDAFFTKTADVLTANLISLINYENENLVELDEKKVELTKKRAKQIESMSFYERMFGDQLDSINSEILKIDESIRKAKSGRDYYYKISCPKLSKVEWSHLPLYSDFLNERFGLTDPKDQVYFYVSMMYGAAWSSNSFTKENLYLIQLKREKLTPTENFLERQLSNFMKVFGIAKGLSVPIAYLCYIKLRD